MAVVEKEVSTYSLKQTQKKVISGILITIISTILSYGVTYLAKFKIEVPAELESELVVFGVIMINGAISGIRNWLKHRKSFKIIEEKIEDIIDMYNGDGSENIDETLDNKIVTDDGELKVETLPPTDTPEVPAEEVK